MALTQVSTGGIKDGQVHTADLADAQITAAKLHADALDRTYTLGASGTNHYTFTGEGLTGAVNDPTLYLTRGKTYRFVNGNSAGAHPFRIQTTVNGSAGTEYNTGVTNNGGAGGSTIIFEVPHDAPDVLYYQCTSHGSMGGILYVTGALADGTVTTAKLAADAVTSAKIANGTIQAEDLATNAVATDRIADGAVTTVKIADSNVTTVKIADEAVTLAKLEHGTSSNDGKFLRANNGADPTFESLPSSGLSNIVEDTTPQLGGDLASNGQDIKLANNDKIIFGTGNDAEIFHNDTDFHIDAEASGGATRNIYITGGSVNEKLIEIRSKDNEPHIRCYGDGEVHLYHDNSKKLETTSTGINITGGVRLGGNAAAHELSYYEEGTWTPATVNGWGILNGSGTNIANAAITEGKYVKVGDIVHLYFTFKEGGSSGASFNGHEILFYGLPFYPETDAQWPNSGNKSHALNAFTDVNAGGGGEGVFCVVAKYGNTSLGMLRRVNGGITGYSGNNLGSSGQIFVSGTYRAA